MKVISEEMTASEVIKRLLDEKGITQKEFAGMIGKSPAAFCNQLRQGYMGASDFQKMLSILGYEIIIRPVEK